MIFVSFRPHKERPTSGVFESKTLSIYVNDENVTYQCERYQAAGFGHVASVYTRLGTHCTRTVCMLRKFRSAHFH